MKPLDALDRRILQFLQEDARLTHKEIAARLHLSITPVYERTRRLEADGYIQRYVALLDRNKLGFKLTAWCNVQLKEHTKPFLKAFEARVGALPEVIECYHIAGMYDYLLRVVVPDMEAYQNFIVHKLADLPNIGNVQSSFVMTEIKYSTALPVAHGADGGGAA